MRHKDTVFYRGNQAVQVNFSSDEISSDEAVLLLVKMERQEKLIRYFSKCIPDSRDPHRVAHTVEKMLKQRVIMLVQAYEDCIDVTQLGNDPLFKDLAGTSTLISMYREAKRVKIESKK